ncbi:L-aminopeptidase/D-esterase [Peptoclostridium litorale DSM 5388]|uniref:Peptidase S58 family protein n=1 Tax=Peptoclostridium litorale DSM 5388 TaxID=1121324 RepID=A0A069RL25_PEPLI|nr:P1 family peptidase [Peptoclostridium litorale]KDR94922.1 peptidase S58 family protein [Peptoclostridium litorale DSM 5388]SIN95741.1 L-aminopeptidase/D-esterase [Peptoclostridium litorale DSM 5388]
MDRENGLGIKGVRVGSAQNDEGLTGCTVIICERGGVCSVDVRGAAPGTRETDLLDPVNMIEKVHAVVLAGGSAFGLDSCSGVMRYLEEKGVGFDVGVAKVPIVTGAVLFDLNVGDPKARPSADMGYEACISSEEGKFKQGCFGAGCGASVGKALGSELAMKSGMGMHSMKCEDGLVVSSIVAVNAYGDVYENGRIIAGALSKSGGFADSRICMSMGENDNGFTGKNTTIGAVITNAILTKAQAKRISYFAHDGYARAINPVHTLYDGDSIFTLATGSVDADINRIGILAAESMEKAIISAVKNADSSGGLKSYKDVTSQK